MNPHHQQDQQDPKPTVYPQDLAQRALEQADRLLSRIESTDLGEDLAVQSLAAAAADIAQAAVDLELVADLRAGPPVRGTDLFHHSVRHRIGAALAEVTSR